MSGFEVIKAGSFTLIEDFGRFSYMYLGISTSGYLDEFAALMANKLLENNFNAPLLETFFGNIKLKALGETTICITGAKCEIKINGILEDCWKCIKIKAEDIIELGKIYEGQRIYLAVKGGFIVKKELGSASTSIKEALGGIKARQLLEKDFLPFKPCKESIKRALIQNDIPKYSDELILRVVLSYQEKSFSKDEKKKFFSSEYIITNEFNRMGCKLSGEAIHSSVDGIISEGIAFGSIQIPKDGQPIILLKERQTIGGYPKIGSVLSIDCFKLAQMRVGSKIRFEQIELKKAQEKTKLFYSYFF